MTEIILKCLLFLNVQEKCPVSAIIERTDNQGVMQEDTMENLKLVESRLNHGGHICRLETVTF